MSPNAAGTASDQAIINQELVDQVSRDMRAGELLVLPLTLLIMALVFGGFMLAGMPLAGALVSICAALGSLWGLSYLVDIESSVLNDCYGNRPGPIHRLRAAIYLPLP